jgi:histidine decarboxylase
MSTDLATAAVITDQSSTTADSASATTPVDANSGGADGPGGDRVGDVLRSLREHLDADRATNIGFPSTFDFDYRPLWPMFNYVLNNVGDPYSESAYPANTKHLEREVVEFFADALRAPREDRWGYVTTGGSEGIEYGLLLARTLLPEATVYVSAAAHYSVRKIVDKLRMACVVIRTRPDGGMDIADLRRAVVSYRDRPAIVLATIGTTMTEAVDDVATIRKVMANLAVQRCYIHADAALSGLPLALLDPEERPAFDLADGADSISVSGHKALGSPFPCGVVVTRRSSKQRVGAAVDYIGTHDTTIGGSRSGHAPLVLWYAVRLHGGDGLRHRFDTARQVAQYAVDRLRQAGWPAWKHPHAMTVVLDTPPAAVVRRWRLASSNGTSHIVAVPGVSTAQVDQLVAELTAAASAPRAPALPVPPPRRPDGTAR